MFLPTRQPGPRVGRASSVRYRSLALLVSLLAIAPLQAGVTRVEIQSRSDVLQGQTFGDTGGYERLTGKVYYALRVDNPRNDRIVDLGKAVNRHDGLVEFSADFIALRPKDPARGNGALLLENPNRGHSRIVALMDGGDWDVSRDAGDAWLLRSGYTFVSLGWQWDAADADALKLYAPIARDGAKKISGLLRGDFMLWHAAQDVPLGHLIDGIIGGTEYPVAEPKDARNVLTVRKSREAPRTVIPRSQWKFAHLVAGKLVPSDRHLHLEGGFQPGKIYEYVYVVTDPVIAGLGFAAVRDFASYVKHGTDATIRANRVYGEGISQNGRFLRDFLYEGFNADEDGRMALDAVLSHVAGAGRGSFNYRFAQPSRDAQPTSAVFFPTDIFPFTDLPETGTEGDGRAGLLDRAVADHVVPKIFFSNTSYEYWGRAAALIHVDREGRHDVPQSPQVRIYHLTGLQHYSGPRPPRRGSDDLLGQQPQSPLPVRYFWRAMLQNIDAWARNATPPPPSSHPRLDDGTLVPLASWSFPAIPGANRPHEASTAYPLDFGPDWRDGILSVQPPKVGHAYPELVPQVDADGNERDGVRLPELAVPLATYTGWNLRDPSIGAPGERVAFEGSWFPFAHTAAERSRSGDPRPSIEERYPSREAYLERYTRALDDLIRQRWILAEDRTALLEIAARDWAEATR